MVDEYEERAAKIIRQIQDYLTREGYSEHVGHRMGAGPGRAIVVYKNRITVMIDPDQRQYPIEFETAVTWLAEELRDIDFWKAYHEAKRKGAKT